MTHIQRTREEEPVLLTEANLPGPDTITKRDALLDADPRLQQMLTEAVRVGWPAAFTNDLYQNDRRILADHPGEPMVWILRDHGTHLFPTECESKGEAHYARNVIHYWSGEHTLNYSDDTTEAARYYLVTPGGLTPLAWREAKEAIEVRSSGS
ncbi:hypothetical protein [Botrimarina mediterranea]|uniref:hypothetical protein n=1 Tax=Botrimarina mediterranea TaxID=2528022 RepID=UPI00118A4956|nr:hypothetical protein K2D_46700 [Planctomycetes bacterium K2D]